MSDTFFSVGSFQTLAGCVASVVIMVSTTRHVFNWGPRWFGLIVALIVSVAAYNLAQTTTPLGLTTFAIIVLNSCLIYTSAFGIQNTVIAPENDSDSLKPPVIANQAAGNNGSRTFTSSW